MVSGTNITHYKLRKYNKVYRHNKVPKQAGAEKFILGKAFGRTPELHGESTVISKLNPFVTRSPIQPL